VLDPEPSPVPPETKFRKMLSCSPEPVSVPGDVNAAAGRCR